MQYRMPFIDSVFYGATLRDTYICPQGSVRFHQTVHHKEYIQWLYRQLSPMCTTGGLQNAEKVRNTVLYSSVRFNTRCLFKDFCQAFYVETRKKRLPLCFESRLDANMFTIWYMYDSSCIYSLLLGRGALLHLTNFTQEKGIHI
jgi:hypothetical protein